MEKCAELKVAQNASNATEQLKRTLKDCPAIPSDFLAYFGG
jgi:hypothetical protein